MKKKIEGINEKSTLDEMKLLRKELENYLTVEFAMIQVNLSDTLNKIKDNNNSKNNSLDGVGTLFEPTINNNVKKQEEEEKKEMDEELNSDEEGEGEFEVTMKITELIEVQDNQEDEEQTTVMEEESLPAGQNPEELKTSKNEKQEDKTPKNVVTKEEKKQIKKTKKGEPKKNVAKEQQN